MNTQPNGKMRRVPTVVPSIALLIFIAVSLVVFTFAILAFRFGSDGKRHVHIMASCTVLSNIGENGGEFDQMLFPFKFSTRGHQVNISFQRKHIDNEKDEQILHFVVSVHYQIPYWMLAESKQTEIDATKSIIGAELLKLLGIEKARVEW